MNTNTSQDVNRAQINTKKETLPSNSSTRPASPSETTNLPSKKSVKVNISYPIAGDNTVNPLSVDAFLPEIVTDEGLCTATFTSPNGNVTTRDAQVRATANSSSCSSIELEKEKFNTTGIWKVIVTYSSSTASGTSESVNFEVANE